MNWDKLSSVLVSMIQPNIAHRAIVGFSNTTFVDNFVPPVFNSCSSAAQSSMKG